MARDKSADPEKKEKKDKKDKKRKLEETDDAAPAAEAKREKKDKKRKSTDGASFAVDADGDVSIADVGDADGQTSAVVKLDALVPFANPLCDDKALKKVLKSVKKAAKNKALKRGVKECVKSIRKSPTSDPSALTPGATTVPLGIVVLAADISPIDVISHIPVLCEDHNIPYVYVPSRAELGAAGSTKRPTSVVMVTPRGGGAAKRKEGATEAATDEEREWEEAYKELHKVAVKLGQSVKV